MDGLKEAVNENPMFWSAMESLKSAAVEAEEYNLVATLKPRIFIDGNQWCVLYGENLQNGVAGFGSSPVEAVWDFNKSWRTKLEETK